VTTSCPNQRNKSNNDAPRKAPRLVLGSGSAFAELMAEALRARGWDVYTAKSEEAVKAAIRKNPAAVVIPVSACGESGYLTAAKLRRAKPKMKVVLVGERTAKAEKLARFVGAEFAAESDGVGGLLTAFATGCRC
jgi:ActR/RegA family two-component response regulator